MHTRVIAGRPVGVVGFGAMELSVRGRPSEADAIRLLHEAWSIGVTLTDTADAYCRGPDEAGHNERLIARALATAPVGADPLISTKGGQYRTADGTFPIDGRPSYLRAACERSLRNLSVDTIELYQLHRPDPRVPYAESVGALADLQRAGKIRHIGLSNVTEAHLADAQRLVTIVTVQNELSADQPAGLCLARACARQGIAFLAYSPLGGRHRAAELGQRHPRFAELARARGVSVQRVAIAWLLSTSPATIPIPGVRRPRTLRDSAAAASLELSARERAMLDAAIGRHREQPGTG
jgi:aryl-alcohol dehydrogenase-like predicted oxidoreductase